MAQFGKTSLERLESCESDLQVVMKEVIKYFDCTIVSGHRPPEEQFELYKKGRKEVNGEWVIVDKSKVVTYKDGTIKKSKHNEFPSKAVDVMPYPIDWKDNERITYLAGFIMATARIFKDRGIIDSHITWGNDWDNDTITKDERFSDRPHYQIM